MKYELKFILEIGLKLKSPVISENLSLIPEFYSGIYFFQIEGFVKIYRSNIIKGAFL